MLKWRFGRNVSAVQTVSACEPSYLAAVCVTDAAKEEFNLLGVGDWSHVEWFFEFDVVFPRRSSARSTL